MPKQANILYGKHVRFACQAESWSRCKTLLEKHFGACDKQRMLFELFQKHCKKLSFSHNAYTMWPNRTKLFSEQSSNVWEVNDVCHVWPGFSNTLLSSKSLSVACWKMLTILSWKYNAALTQVLLSKKQCIKILRQMIAFQRLLGE